MKTWFNECSAYALTDKELVLFTPRQFKASIIENKYGEEICRLLNDIMPFNYGLRVLSDETMDNYANAQRVVADDSEFTFEKFVVGKQNNFAYSAARAVASGSKDYNPLFIYGNSGLGKTHLMRAVRNEVQKLHPEYKIIYITGEDFTNNLVMALRNSKMSEFRSTYRLADIFLMDDVQFVGGKEQTMEEFFHTFNELHMAGKQIVLTSDRPPVEIARLEDRLKTRFESGLMADIQPPDFETRVAIAQNKAAELKFNLPQEIAELLAEQLVANIRQLEGAVKRIHAMLTIGGADAITAPLVSSKIKDMIRESEKSVTANSVIEETAAFYMLKPEEIRGKSRVSEINRARQIAMYLMRTLTQLPLTSIGEMLGRDHTTIINGTQKVEADMKTSEKLRDEIRDLTNIINSRALEK